MAVVARKRIGDQFILLVNAPPNDGGGTAGNAGDWAVHLTTPATWWINSNGTATGWVQK